MSSWCDKRGNWRQHQARGATRRRPWKARRYQVYARCSEACGELLQQKENRQGSSKSGDYTAGE
jgi:hypothetical protein